MKINSKPHIHIFRYKEFRAMGVEGRLSMSLEEVDRVLQERGIETARYKHDSREMIDGISFSPVMDLGLVELKRRKGYGLVVKAINKPSLTDDLLGLASEIGLVATGEYRNDFYPDIVRVGSMLVANYDFTTIIARKAGVPLDAALGSVAYLRFLKEHKGYSANDAIKKSWKKFGIKDE